MPRLLALVSLFLMMCSSLNARAAEPAGSIISYQGYLADAERRPVEDKTHEIAFKIYAGGDYANPVYMEKIAVATVAGKFNAFLHISELVFDPSRSYEVAAVIGAEEFRQPIVAVPMARTAMTVSSATSAGTPQTIVQRDGSGAFAAGGIIFPDGNIQTTAYDPARVVRITPIPTQSITGTNGIRLRFENVTGADHFLRFGLYNTTLPGATSPITVTDQFAMRADGGLLARGILGYGLIPASGAGSRLMWYPFKSSFRVGGVDADQWDDVNNGFYSIATGYSTRAPGLYSVAMGNSGVASGTSAVALGNRAEATNTGSVAIGTGVTASGQMATALGQSTTASGNYTTAIGRYASTNGHQGSFVYGDSTGSSVAVLNAVVDNQFAVRAQSIWLGKSSAATATAGRFLETSTGAYLSNTGVWTNNSSRDLKTAFSAVDAQAVLRRVVNMPVTEWSYRANPDERHIGPMAQDFALAFGLGLGNESIATVDADGVALAAIQGLNAEIKERDERIAALEARLDALEKLIAGRR